MCVTRARWESFALQPLDPDGWSDTHQRQMGSSVSLATALGGPANDGTTLRYGSCWRLSLDLCLRYWHDHCHHDERGFDCDYAMTACSLAALRPGFCSYDSHGRDYCFSLAFFYPPGHWFALVDSHCAGAPGRTNLRLRSDCGCSFAFCYQNSESYLHEYSQTSVCHIKRE